MGFSGCHYEARVCKYSASTHIAGAFVKHKYIYRTIKVQVDDCFTHFVSIFDDFT